MTIERTTAASAAGSAEGARRLRVLLRERCGPVHEDLDREFADMATGTDLAPYRRFIAVNEAVHRRIEPILAASPLAAALADGLPSPRHDLLVQDLAALGIEPIEAAAFPLASPDRAQAAGIAYVVEGSRLGARVLSRTLMGEDGPRPASLAYLTGAAAPFDFPRFLAEIAALVESDGDQARMVAAAEATFAYTLVIARSSAAAKAGAERPGAPPR